MESHGGQLCAFCSMMMIYTYIYGLLCSLSDLKSMHSGYETYSYGTEL